MEDASIEAQLKEQSDKNVALFKRGGANALSKKNEQLLAAFGDTPDVQMEALSKLSSDARNELYVEGRLLCLSSANLAGANLIDANLAWADLTGDNLTDANLARTNLAGARLPGANLERAGLVWTNLASANLASANLAGANLRDTNLAGANLTGVIGLERIVDHDFVIFNANTKIDEDAPQWMCALRAAAKSEGATHARWEGDKAVPGRMIDVGQFVPLPPKQSVAPAGAFQWMCALRAAAKSEGATHARWEGDKAVPGRMIDVGQFVPLPPKQSVAPAGAFAGAAPSTQVTPSDTLLEAITRGLALCDNVNCPPVTGAREKMAEAIAGKEEAKGKGTEKREAAQAAYETAKQALVDAYAAGREDGNNKSFRAAEQKRAGKGETKDSRSSLRRAENDINTIENAVASDKLARMGEKASMASR